MDDATLLKRVAVEVLEFTEAQAAGLYLLPALAWNDAGRVVEKMREKGWDFKIDNYGTKYGAMFFKKVPGSDLDPLFVASDEKAARAVFLAALKAMEGGE